MTWNFRLWGFGEAIALRGLLRSNEAIGHPEAFGYVHALLRAYLARGPGRSPEEHVAPGSELLLLYRATGDQAFLDAARRLADLHASFPVGPSGARYHRRDQPGWRRQIWVDCMDAEPPFLALLGAMTGEGRYFDQAAGEILAYAQLLQDPVSGLFHHGFEEACGANGQIWARGNGWALLGLLETLRQLPDADPRRTELRDRFALLCSGLHRFQDRGGLWHTVIPEPETHLESTLAAMAAYAIREARGLAILDGPKFEKMEQAARTAVLGLVREDGSLGLVTDATPIGELAMYATRPFGTFPWGQGILLSLLTQP